MELKRTFQSGKMNRNEDERLVRNGEYREALNVNIGRSESADIGAIENVLGNVEVEGDVIGGRIIGAHRDNTNDRLYFFATTNESDIEANEGDHAIYLYEQGTNQISLLAEGSWLNFHPNYLITGINFMDELLFFTDDRNEPRKINVTRALNNTEFYNSDNKAAVIKLAPIAPPIVADVRTTGNSSSFLREKFVRFAYRYKFNDGEFSTISPLTPIVFKSIKGRTLTNNDYGSGFISDFVNEAKQIDLEVQVPVNAGITGVELLYNESSRSTIYVLEELAAETDSLDDDPITVSYTYDSQDPFKALPSSQLTRVYDAVPRKAKSQELAGGRLVYGNYLQNYNLPSLSFQVETKTLADDDDNQFNRFSVKTNRTYQVGVVLADNFGRQSPVILSSTGGDTLFVDAITGEDAMQQMTVQFNNPDSIPDWAVSYRIVVKQRQQEYYNWFFGETASFTPDLDPITGFLVSGTNLNKIPRDQTQEVIILGNSALAQSDRKVYPKYDSTDGNVVASEDIQVSNLLIQDTGNTYADVRGAGIDGQGVFETSPRESELDIFYETSTAGMVSDIGADPIDVDFYNCYIFNIGNGHLELNRIRAGFNEPWLTVGLKAYAVQENFAELRRFNTLIHSSSFFNSRVGLNNINQFNETEGGLTISLDPADGSIQKLWAEDTQMIIFQEDKVSRSPIDKNFIYGAEGGAIPITSSTQYLGTISPYAGEYGISKNPESFAVYGMKKYFTDKKRGVALRLGGDGLTEISEKGMSDFFRDALAQSTNAFGSFDEYHDQYNITINGVPAYGGFKDTNIATGKDGYFTVSYEEEVQGWPSFKSFQQEYGTTLNNRYYTFNGGKLWEHNVGDIYNNFYGIQNTSYVECIFNDQPSDVKEFKTVNYEGLDGWICDTVETEQDEYTLDPDARNESDVIKASLVVTEEVTDGRVSGIQSQNVVVGETYRWIIKVDTATSDFVFDSPSNVILTIDGIGVPGQLSDNSIYFVTDPYLAGDVDASLEVLISGASVRDTSGAILIIRVADNIGEDEVELGITATNLFRGGPSVFEYVSGAENTNVELEARTDEDGLYALNGDALTITYGDNLTEFLDGIASVSSELHVYKYEQAITLPSIQTNGIVTVGVNGVDDVLLKKTEATLAIPTKAGETANFTILNADATEFVAIDLGVVNEDETISYDEFYIVPVEGQIVLEEDVTTGVTQRAITGAILANDNLPDALLGSIGVSGSTAVGTVGTDRNDTSVDQTIDLTITVDTRPTDQFLVSLTDQDDADVDGYDITIDPNGSAKAKISNDDFKYAYYYVLDSDDADITGVYLDDYDGGTAALPESGDAFEAGDETTINITDKTEGVFRIILIPQESPDHIGDTFTNRTITITVDDGTEG